MNVKRSLCCWLLFALSTAAQAPGQKMQDQPDDGQWTMPAKNYASTRFSTLTDINTETVKHLKLAWTFSTGLTRGHEAAPLVVNSTMYIVTPWPNILYALDLTKPGSPVKWSYKPKPAASSQGVACCDVVNRGAVALMFMACALRPNAPATGGSPRTGAQDLGRLGCGSCHTIPGIVGAHGKVGPSLQGIAGHSYIAGQLPNQPSNLEHWIQHPHSIHPDTLMPELGVTDAQSRDIAAYLYSLNWEIT